MDFIITVVITVVLGIVCSLAAAEFYANGPRIAKWLISRAVLRLPDNARDRYQEEWEAHSAELPGSMAKLQHALGCRFRASAVARALAGPKALGEDELRILETILAYYMRIRSVPLVLSSLLKGDFFTIKFCWAFFDRFAHLCIESKFKHNASDAQLKAMVHRYVQRMETLTKLARENPPAFEAWVRKAIADTLQKDPKGGG